MPGAYGVAMDTETMTFSLPQEKALAFREAAAANHVEVETALGDAVSYYLEYDREFREAVEEGIRQADAGEVVPHQKVVARYEAWKQAHSLK